MSSNRPGTSVRPGAMLVGVQARACGSDALATSSHALVTNSDGLHSNRVQTAHVMLKSCAALFSCARRLLNLSAEAVLDRHKDVQVSAPRLREIRKAPDPELQNRSDARVARLKETRHSNSSRELGRWSKLDTFSILRQLHFCWVEDQFKGDAVLDAQRHPVLLSNPTTHAE